MSTVPRLPAAGKHDGVLPTGGVRHIGDEPAEAIWVIVGRQSDPRGPFVSARWKGLRPSARNPFHRA